MYFSSILVHTIIYIYFNPMLKINRFIMRIVLVFMKTVMVPVGLYWFLMVIKKKKKKKTGVMNETHLSLFHSALNHARRKHSRNSVSSAARYAFNSLF